LIVATYPNNPLPWEIKSGRWIDADGEIIPFTQEDERLMFLAKIQTLKDELHAEKARVDTAEHCFSKANRELSAASKDRSKLVMISDELLSWEQHMGGFESPVWGKLRKAMAEVSGAPYQPEGPEEN
jgi:hypothetical protein